MSSLVKILRRRIAKQFYKLENALRGDLEELRQRDRPYPHRLRAIVNGFSQGEVVIRQTFYHWLLPIFYAQGINKLEEIGQVFDTLSRVYNLIETPLHLFFRLFK